jgi:hypothetical protein
MEKTSNSWRDLTCYRTREADFNSLWRTFLDLKYEVERPQRSCKEIASGTLNVKGHSVADGNYGCPSNMPERTSQRYIGSNVLSCTWAHLDRSNVNLSCRNDTSDAKHLKIYLNCCNY